MKTGTSFAAVALLALIAAGCASSSSSDDKNAAAEKKPLRVEDSWVETVTATVQSIDYGTREVTLKKSTGDTVTFTVDKRVQKLNDVRVGDKVKVEYYESIARELRPPTEAEKASPVMMVAGTSRAPVGTEPVTGALRVIKVVTTVKAIDLPKQWITLEVPGGKTTTLRAKSLDNLKKVKVGDNIIVTYTEGLAVSVEKVDAPAK